MSNRSLKVSKINIGEIVIGKVADSLIGLLLGIFLENKFKISQWLKKTSAYILNKPVSLKPVIILTSNKSSKQIGKSIIEIWKKQGFNVSVIKDSENFYAITNGIYNIDLGEMEDEIIIQTSKLETSVRQIYERFSEFLDILEQTNHNANIEEINLSISFPYKYEFFEIKPISYFQISDYEIKLKNDKWKSEMMLKLKGKNQELKINGKSTSEINQILNKLFRPL